MMIKIICEDNKRFEAETFEDLVSSMKLDAWLPHNRNEYMKEVARRCKVWDGRGIEYSTAEEFISELRRVDVIKFMVCDFS